MENKQEENKGTNKPRESKCRSCGEDIIFISYTRKDGSQGFHPCDNKTVKIITKTGRVVVGMQSHFSSCVNTDQWRKGVRKDEDKKNNTDG